MFVRKKKNKSGTISIQIIIKDSGKYKVVETIGSTKDKNQLDYLIKKAHYRISQIIGQEELELFSKTENDIVKFLTNNDSLKIKVIGPENILGSIYDKMGFNQINEELFRNLVITRLVYPGSKLKTIDYLRRYGETSIDVDKIYRFLDKLNKKYKTKVEEITYQHTRKILGGKIGIVFYDITTLYFEASSEDDMRRLGFSKDGKAQNPQILLGLLVGVDGYPIGYEMYKGNSFEGHTLLPILEKYQKKLETNKPVVIADSGLLSTENIKQLEGKGYKYIIGGRLKNESAEVKNVILKKAFESCLAADRDGEAYEIKKGEKIRLIISYSKKRASKDEHNRQRGLNRLEKNIAAERLTKKQINNRGYNKYLKLTGEIKVEIDYEKFNEDKKWDGLKSYITNSKLPKEKVIENYRSLWQIEKAFRISKTDLKVRPIYHRLKERIEAHICVAFTAYAIYKELERLLHKKKISFSAKRAIELTETIYQLDFILPESKQKLSIKINLTEEQKLLYLICN